MKQILKHSFEAVSLLSTDNGVLDLTIIPASNQPDWLVPSSLILGVEEYDERVHTYQWQQQEVAAFHLGPRDSVLDKVVIVEGNSEVHRLALQTSGELETKQVRISDMRDIELSEIDDDISSAHQEQVDETVVSTYLFQAVMIDDTPYIVPDFDKIAHQLVDLDR